MIFQCQAFNAAAAARVNIALKEKPDLFLWIDVERTYVDVDKDWKAKRSGGDTQVSWIQRLHDSTQCALSRGAYVAIYM